MSIFIKVVDEAVSEKQLSVEIAKVQPIKIESESAEQIVKNLEELLGKKDSFILIAGANIFSDELVLMEEIFNIFEDQNINDSAHYYRIIQNSSEDYNFEIYCRSGSNIEIKRFCSIWHRTSQFCGDFFSLDFSLKKLYNIKRARLSSTLERGINYGFL